MDKNSLIVTSEMIDNLKVTVIAFLTVEIVLALAAFAWVGIFNSMYYQLVGPAFLVLYSSSALWVVSHQWAQFKTKLAVLN